jgi:hypothetical protein
MLTPSVGVIVTVGDWVTVISSVGDCVTVTSFVGVGDIDGAALQHKSIRSSSSSIFLSKIVIFPSSPSIVSVVLRAAAFAALRSMAALTFSALVVLLLN